MNPSAQDSSDAETIGYAEALEELEDILAELDDDTIDIDVLSDRVERASVLIGVCRSRINRAHTRVQEVVSGLAGTERSEDDDA